MSYIETKKAQRRYWIVHNLISTILFGAYTQFAISSGIDKSFILISLALLLQIFISFPFAFGKNKLWSFTHKSFKKYDEREAQISGYATRIAYVIFTILALSVFVILSVFEMKVSITLVVSLIYIAHILPGSIIGMK